MSKYKTIRKAIIICTAVSIFLILVSFIIAISLIRFKTAQSNMDFKDFIKTYAFHKGVFRKPSGLKYKKAPIVLYGCSYTYGTALKENETFSAQLSEYTKRPVYNYGIEGHCIQHFLFLAREANHYKNFPEPEYVIYTYIPAHLNRIMHTNYFGNTAYLQYKIKDNHLVQVNSIFKFWHPTLFFNIIQETQYDKFFDKDTKKRHALLKLYFLELRNAFHKVYPNTKFVILLYDYSYIDKNLMWKELEDDGFIIYKISELAKIKPGSEEYSNPKKIDFYTHPNKKAWEKIVPALSKELNLI